MRTARDVLNELKWREDKSLAGCEVYYVHRGAPGDFKVIKGDEIEDLGRSFIYLERGQIPYHRVFKIVSRKEVIFSRERS